jgi:hypothetical protein
MTEERPLIRTFRGAARGLPDRNGANEKND